jgi:citrate synthase
MASALRLTGAFRAAAPLRTPAFSGLRFYSAGKTTVSATVCTSIAYANYARSR